MAALDFNAVDHPPLEPIESIKARTDIVDVVGRYADLKKRNGRLSGRAARCTPTARPSFKVNPDRQSFICFGCGAKGDVFDFVMAAESVGTARRHRAHPGACGRRRGGPGRPCRPGSPTRRSGPPGGPGGRPAHCPGPPDLERGGIPHAPL